MYGFLCVRVCVCVCVGGVFGERMWGCDLLCVVCFV